MKRLIKSAFFRLIVLYHQKKFDAFYHKIMKINGIDDKPVDGEKEWIARWSQFGAKARPAQYRVFSHYKGADINIVPEDICHDFIEPILNPVRLAGYYEDKNMFDRLFPNGFFPKTILRKMNGHFYDADYSRIELDETNLNTLLNNASNGKIILKPSIDGNSGVGVKLFELINEKWLSHDNSQELTAQYLYQDCGSDIIIQEAVSQSDYINQFNPTSVNTLRISLYRSVKDDKCHVTRAMMRIGAKGSFIDNAHAGGYYVGINQEGSFCHEVLDQFGQRLTDFNGIDYRNDFQYPNWDNVVKFAESVGQYIPHHRLLALDIYLDVNNNPHLIEYNVLYYAPWLFQYSVGPAFDMYTDEILEYCKQNLSKNRHALYI